MTDAPPPQDPYAGHQPPPPQHLGKGMAITALVLGAIALLFSWTVLAGLLFGVIALVLGLIAAGRAKKGVAAGRGMAITGAVLGLLGVLAAIAVIFIFGAFWESSGGAEYAQCITDAGNDQAAIEQCERQFEDNLDERFGG